MKNFKLTISYDGSRYSGWERQPGRDTIQGKLETVLSRMVNAEVNVIGAGRTDAGVHARAMVANCYLETELQPDEIRDYMNRYLPDDICVDEVPCPIPRGGKALYLHLLRGRDEAGFQPQIRHDARLRAGCGGDAASGGDSDRRT